MKQIRSITCRTVYNSERSKSPKNIEIVIEELRRQIKNMNPAIHLLIVQLCDYVNEQQEKIRLLSRDNERLKQQIQVSFKGQNAKMNYYKEVQIQNILLKFSLQKKEQQNNSFQSIKKSFESNNMLRIKSENKVTKRNALTTQNEFMNHLNDFMLLKPLLDLEENDQKIKKNFQTNYNYVILNKLQQQTDEENWKHLQSMDINTLLREILEPSKFINSLIMGMLSGTLKLKRLIKAALILNPTLILTDTFEKMVEQTCKILECDRASVYLLDHKNGRLWSKSALGTKTIMVNLNQGLAGWVAKNGKILNVLDAHQDERFNPENDRKINYRTKSVLAVPIFDQERTQVVGVIQAINKLTQEYFSKDDEGMITIFSQFSTTIFRNTMHNDKKTRSQNNLRKLFQIGLQLTKCKSMKDLVMQSEECLIESFEIEMVRFYLKGDDRYLYRYDQDGRQIFIEQDCGLVGQCFQQKQILSSQSCYKDNLYNGKSDIETQLPVLNYPIIRKDQEIVGVIQLTDARRIDNLLMNSVLNFSNSVYEILNSFIDIFDQIYQKLK